MSKRQPKPSTELPETLTVGLLVRFKTGDTGTYRVMDTKLAPDKSVRLYGGDTNPMGRRQSRAGMRAQLQLEDRPEVLKAMRKRTE